MQTILPSNFISKFKPWRWIFFLCLLAGISKPAAALADVNESTHSAFYCPTPSGLYATNITSTSAQLGWSYVSGASYYWLQYRVNGGNWTTVQANTNSYYLSGLTPGTVYQFQVATVCYNSEVSGYSYPFSFTTTGSSCQIPTWLMSTNILCYSAHLSWDIMPGAISYTVEWKSEYDNTWTGLVTVNNNWFDLLSLQPNTWYQWRIKSNCANGGSSPYSAIQSFGTPYCQGCNAPSNLTTYNINYNSATLSWSAVANAAYYIVEYRMSSQYNNWTSVIANGTTLQLNNLYANTSYEWRVKTHCYNNSESSWSYISNFTTLYVNCYAPTWLSTTNIQCNMATANWDPVPGAYSYYIQWKEIGSNTWTYSGTTNGNSFNMMGLANNTSYVWRVRTNCGNGNQSSFSDYVYFSTNCQPPCTVPTNLYASNITGNSATLGWSSSPNATYTLQYRLTNSGNWITINTPNNFYQLTGLQSNTSYTFHVKAICSGGWSDYSYDFTFITGGYSSCPVPTWTMENNITNTSAVLSWDAMPGACGYTVEWRQVNTNTWNSSTIQNTQLYLTNLQAATQYEWRVRTNCCNNGYSAWSNIRVFTTGGYSSCPIPTWTMENSITNNSVTLSWDGMPGACGYTVEWRQTNTTVWNSSTIQQTALFVSNLQAATQYEWRVRTNCCNYSYSAWSNIRVFTTGGYSNCAVPTWTMENSITNTTAVLSWDAMPGACGYTVEWRQVNTNTWNSSTMQNTQLYLSNLQAATQYEWRVRTNCCNNGYSAWSNIRVFTTGGYSNCPIPTWTMENTITNNSVTLSWDGMPGACSYTVEWRQTNTTVWNSSTIQQTALFVSNLQAATQYEWRVRTNCCNNGYSGWSNIRVFTTGGYSNCPIPTWTMENNITSNSVTLSWDAMPGACGYTVEWKQINSNTWNSSTVQNTQLYLNNLLAGTQYQWRVRTNCCNNGYSGWSNTRTFTTQGGQYCNAPSGLTSYNITGSSAVLSWNAVAGASFYQVQYKPTNSNNWITVSVYGTTTTINNLSNNTTYWWQVRACCSNGSNSPYSYEANFTTTGYWCSAPTWLGESNLTNTSATLSWDPVQNAGSYFIQWGYANSNQWLGSATVNGTSYTLTNLNPNTAYVWHVRTNCYNGDQSDYSNLDYFNTNGSPTCGIPTYLWANNITNNSAVVGWNTVYGAVSYTVEYQVSGSGNINTVTTSANNIILNNLAAGTTYTFRVRTNCGNGYYSAYSYMLWFTTTGGYCGIPQNTYEGTITYNTANLNWAAVSGAISYTLQWKPNGSQTWNQTQVGTNTVTLATLQANTTYQWRVKANCGNGYYSDYSATDQFTTANYNGNLPNDNPCGAYSLPTSANCMPAGATNVGATNTTTPPPPGACAYNGGDIWFVTTVPAGGMVTIHTSAGTLNDVVLALYTGTCNSLNYVTCIDDYNGSTMPSIMYTGTPGTILYIRVWGYGGNQGTFNICATAAVGDLKIDMGDTYLADETDLVKSSTENIEAQVQIREQSGFTCYPNPTNKYITVEVPEGTFKGTQVSIIDMQGRQLIKQNMDSDKSTFDLGNYLPGIYIIRLDNAKQSLIEKVVLQP